MKSVHRLDEPPVEEQAVQGQVFTPPELAELLALALLTGWPSGAGQVSSGGGSSPPLKVLDPACGAGALLKALDGLLPPGSERVGIELDAAALAEAQVRLASSPNDTLTPVRLVQGDALTVAADWGGQLDRVVANPPYLAWTRIPRSLRASLEQGSFLGLPFPGRPHHPDSQPDFSLAFLILAAHVLKPMGRLVFLLPTEWLEAPRLHSLRTHLNQILTIRALIAMPARYPLFQSRSGGRIETNALILVADRAPPPPDHSFPWVVLEAGADIWGLRSLLPALLTGAPSSDPLDRSGIQLHRVVQASLESHGWEPLPQVLPPGLVPLGILPGVRIFGGHQPIVSWLDWLTFTEEERDGLPLAERWVLLPALKESREFGWPQVTPSSHFWCLLPPELSERALLQDFPQLMQALRKKREQSLPQSPFEPGWWLFPNPRNRAIAGERGPQLLFPRTAPHLQASWDAVGHTFKGTNTALRVREPISFPCGNVLSPSAILRVLFAYLNSGLGRNLAQPFVRSYHGLAVKLEPTDVRRIPVPNPAKLSSWKAWAQVAAESEMFLHASRDFERVEKSVQDLLARA